MRNGLGWSNGLVLGGGVIGSNPQDPIGSWWPNFGTIFNATHPKSDSLWCNDFIFLSDFSPFCDLYIKKILSQIHCSFFEKISKK
jgi:hypothetical protein